MLFYRILNNDKYSTENAGNQTIILNSNKMRGVLLFIY